MMASLFASVSGLSNHMLRMNIVGDNIANINTIGYKSGRVTFREALVQTLRSAGRPSATRGGTNPVQLGLGVSVGTIDNFFSQGSLETTGQITDLALQGSGFFILSDGQQEFYTRAGAFGFDANSNLVDPSSGLFVQGKMADSNGDILATASLGNIRLPFGQQDPARATTAIDLTNNLDAMATRSEATLTSPGTTSIDSVGGLATNGAGGVHALTIVGIQPTNSTGSGTASAGAMTTTSTLASLGVTQAGLDSGFTLSVDGAPATTIPGLTLTTTVSELINAINNLSGVEASFDSSGTGEIQLKRVYAGDGGSFNIATNTAAAGDIASEVFLNGVTGGVFTVNNGNAHTMVATDVFTPTGGSALPAETLSVSLNATTGLVTGITGLGGGGVTILSSSELAAGTATIETADTEHATSITVFDSLGGKHTAVMTFTKQVTPNAWDWQITFAGDELPLSGSAGSVTFNGDGSLSSFSYADGSNKLTVDPQGGAALMEISLQTGTVGEYDGLTGFAASSSAIAKNQNGYGMGMLDNISIDQQGLITGIFTNGVSRTLAQIVLADFNNPGGLLKSGQTMFATSANSGDALKGIAGSTINARISSGALEGSNVDLAREFTNIIIAQRGFQANARMISTSDQLLNELVNLKQ